MIEIYGRWFTHANRCLWALEELGLEYVVRDPYTLEGEPPSPHVPRGRFGVVTPELFALNPNGKAPALRDGEVVLWESLAINLYLAMRHVSPLSPGTLCEWGCAFQWTEWASNEIEGPLYRRAAILREIGLSNAPPEVVKEAEALAAQLERPLAALESWLRDREYLMADRFTIADLNVAATLSFVLPTGIDLSWLPRARGWLLAALRRPAARKVYARAIEEGRRVGFVGELALPEIA